MQLVVFDLDGTITRHDTLVPYVLGFLLRHPWRVPRLLGLLPALACYAWSRDRGALKAALLRCALGGVTRARLEAWTERFLPHLLASGMFRVALQRIAQHRCDRDMLVLLSASPDLYVPAIARALGFAQAICTVVRWNGARLDGRLATPNRRGQEKTRCLEELRARYTGLPIVAYANSASDIDHLARVDVGVLVNGSAAARRQLAGSTIRCEQWS